MDSFNPGDKVIKRNETDACNYGQVMDLPSSHLKPGYLAVYFQRKVWIKPENIMRFDAWNMKQHKKTVTTDSVREFWTKQRSNNEQ